MNEHRIDITPQAGQFDDTDRKSDDDGVSIGESFLVLVALAAISLVVVSVDDMWTRLAGVLLITGTLAAVIAQRVDVRRTVVRAVRPSRR